MNTPELANRKLMLIESIDGKYGRYGGIELSEEIVTAVSLLEEGKQTIQVGETTVPITIQGNILTIHLGEAVVGDPTDIFFVDPSKLEEDVNYSDYLAAGGIAKDLIIDVEKLFHDLVEDLEGRVTENSFKLTLLYILSSDYKQSSMTFHKTNARLQWLEKVPEIVTEIKMADLLQGKPRMKLKSKR
jgi:hypothetical protein